MAKEKNPLQRTSELISKDGKTKIILTEEFTDKIDLRETLANL